MSTPRLLCPSCSQPLAHEEVPARSKTITQPYHQVFCKNIRCPSDVAQKEGGSGPSIQDAFISLLNAVDNEIENELSEVEKKDRDGWAKADHQNKLARDGV